MMTKLIFVLLTVFSTSIYGNICDEGESHYLCVGEMRSPNLADEQGINASQFVKDIKEYNAFRTTFKDHVEYLESEKDKNFIAGEIAKYKLNDVSLPEFILEPSGLSAVTTFQGLEVVVKAEDYAMGIFYLNGNGIYASGYDSAESFFKSFVSKAQEILNTTKTSYLEMGVSIFFPNAYAEPFPWGTIAAVVGVGAVAYFGYKHFFGKKKKKNTASNINQQNLPMGYFYRAEGCTLAPAADDVHGLPSGTGVYSTDATACGNTGSLYYVPGATGN